MTFVMLGINSHEPLRRLQHHGDYSSLPNDLVSTIDKVTISC